MDKENVYKKKRAFNLGFAAENNLIALQRRDLVNEEAVNDFLDNDGSFAVAILKKMFEISLDGSAVARNPSVFNPYSILVT